MQNRTVRLMLVEPDESLGQLLKGYFQSMRHTVDLFLGVDAAFQAFKSFRYDACVVEVNFPEEEGYRLVAHMRDRNECLPILILSTLTSNDDVVKGLRAGADDYLRKPFNVEELILRISSLLRRSTPSEEEQDLPNNFTIGKFHFDVVRQLLTFEDDTPVRLTTKESELLRQLAIHVNEVLTREHALHMVWSEFSYSNARSMDVYITKLRKILSRDPNVEILNVRGSGFKLVV